jgi:hypothetical protein
MADPLSAKYRVNMRIPGRFLFLHTQRHTQEISVKQPSPESFAHCLPLGGVTRSQSKSPPNN